MFVGPCTLSLQQENEEAMTTFHEIRGDLKLLYSTTLNVTREDALRGINERTPQFKTDRAIYYYQMKWRYRTLTCYSALAAAPESTTYHRSYIFRMTRLQKKSG